MVRLETELGFSWEHNIQAAALRWLPLVRFLNVYYWAAHMASTVGALLLVFFLRPSMYQVRGSFFWALPGLDGAVHVRQAMALHWKSVQSRRHQCKS